MCRGEAWWSRVRRSGGKGKQEGEEEAVEPELSCRVWEWRARAG